MLYRKSGVLPVSGGAIEQTASFFDAVQWIEQGIACAADRSK